MASVCDWTSVFSSGIMCSFFWNAMSFKYPHTKQSKGLSRMRHRPVRTPGFPCSGAPHGLAVIASLGALTTPFGQVRYVCILSHVAHTCAHALTCYTDFKNPVVNVSRWCNMNTKLWTIFSLRSNTTAGRVKGFYNEHFLIRRLWHHLVSQFNIANCNKIRKCAERSVNIT
jgi:hypothetical protein